MTSINDKIEDFLDSRELAKWLKEHINTLEKSWDIDSLKKIWELIKEIFKEKEIKSLSHQDPTRDIISDLFRDKK